MGIFSMANAADQAVSSIAVVQRAEMILNMYLEATFGYEYRFCSFAPSMPWNGAQSGFTRVEFRAEDVQNLNATLKIHTDNLNSAPSRTEVIQAKAKSIWRAVRDKRRDAVAVEEVRIFI
jgi:hypothetical protein